MTWQKGFVIPLATALLASIVGNLVTPTIQEQLDLVGTFLVWRWASSVTFGLVLLANLAFLSMRREGSPVAEADPAMLPPSAGKGIQEARPFGEVIEWMWGRLSSDSPYFGFVVLIVNPSNWDIRVSGYTAPVRVSGEPCGLVPQLPDITVPAQDSREIEIWQPLFPEQAKRMLDASEKQGKVFIGTNEFHLKFTSDDPLYASSELLVGYKYGGPGDYRVVPGFSMKQ